MQEIKDHRMCMCQQWAAKALVMYALFHACIHIHTIAWLAADVCSISHCLTCHRRVLPPHLPLKQQCSALFVPYPCVQTTPSRFIASGVGLQEAAGTSLRCTRSMGPQADPWDTSTIRGTSSLQLDCPRSLTIRSSGSPPRRSCCHSLGHRGQ